MTTNAGREFLAKVHTLEATGLDWDTAWQRAKRTFPTLYNRMETEGSAAISKQAANSRQRQAEVSNARREATYHRGEWRAEINRRMAANGGDYDKAFRSAQRDCPALYETISKQFATVANSEVSFSGMAQTTESPATLSRLGLSPSDPQGVVDIFKAAESAAPLTRAQKGFVLRTLIQGINRIRTGTFEQNYSEAADLLQDFAKEFGAQ